LTERLDRSRLLKNFGHRKFESSFPRFFFSRSAVGDRFGMDCPDLQGLMSCILAACLSHKAQPCRTQRLCTNDMSKCHYLMLLAMSPPEYYLPSVAIDPRSSWPTVLEIKLWRMHGAVQTYAAASQFPRQLRKVFGHTDSLE
jgi:hypothetical protein